jgi:hypothetical protein
MENIQNAEKTLQDEILRRRVEVLSQESAEKVMIEARKNNAEARFSLTPTKITP